MKKLTFTALARARLRENKRSYVNLTVGIFLSVFLVSALFTGLWGMYRAGLEAKIRTLGPVNAFLLDTPEVPDQALWDAGVPDRLGHVSVLARLTELDADLGYCDETAARLSPPVLLAGTLPESPGELAGEETVLALLDPERVWQPGDRLSLDLTPTDGIPERRDYVLSGILADKARDAEDWCTPALLVCPEEPAFATGRAAVHRLIGTPDDRPLTADQWQTLCAAVAAHTAWGGQIYHIDRFGKISPVYEKDVDPDFTFLAVMAGVLAASLLLGCGVGIANSMESLMSRRTREIGMLRAVGATRRQIRRLYAADPLLLCLTVTPAAIAAGCLFTALLARLAPETVVFRFEPWLILPVILVGVTVVLLSGSAPLRRAAGISPMAILRDTGLLRRAAGLRSQRRFRVPKIITRRLFRFYPGRLVGTALLVCLTLVAGTVLFALADDRAAEDDSPAYILEDYSGMGSSEYENDPEALGISQADGDRIRAVPGICRVQTVRRVRALLPVEALTPYLTTLYPELLPGDPGSYQAQQHGEYNALRDRLGEPRHLIRVDVIALEGFDDALERLPLVAGTLDRGAMDRGEAVLVYAPAQYLYKDGFGEIRGSLEQPISKDYTLQAKNDFFSPGQDLPVTVLYTGADTDRREARVRVCGVTEQLPDPVGGWEIALITTAAGLRRLPFEDSGIRTLLAYVQGAPEEDAQRAMTLRIQAITGRYGLNFYDRLAAARQRAESHRQTALVFACLLAAFFAVSAGLIVSGVTRQLRADGARIGMLRAVGANGVTVRRCYSGQVTVQIGLGVLLTFGLFLGSVLAGISGLSLRELRRNWAEYRACLLGCLTAAAALWLVCQGAVTLRVREILNMSMIDSIREVEE